MLSCLRCSRPNAGHRVGGGSRGILAVIKGSANHCPALRISNVRDIINFTFLVGSGITTYRRVKQQMASPRNLAILIFDDVEVLDFCGPFEVFSVANRWTDPAAFNVITVSEKPGPVIARNGLSVNPHYGLEDCPRADLLLVPGGQGTRREMHNEALLDWIKRRSTEAEMIMSVCTGALLLAQVGLLNGLEATTHHGAIGLLREVAPSTTIHEDRRFVDNGRIICSAGVAAGIDMSLHVVARLLGEDIAVKTARQMEYPYDGDGPGNIPQRQWTTTPDGMTIRPYRERDEDQVVRLWQTVFPDDPAWNIPAVDIQRKLTVQRSLFLVGEVAGEVVATVMAGFDGHRGWVHRVAVSPKCQRRGLGRAVMIEAEKRLSEVGCAKVNLQVRTTNHAVVEFYRSLGYATDDRISMGKRLT